MTKRACNKLNEKGDACKANPLRPGTVIDGVTVTGKWCRQHDEDLPPSAKLDRTRTPEQMGGRPRNLKPSDIKRKLMERYELAAQRPYWRTLGYDVVINGAGDCELVELPEGGAKLFGESKDGQIQVSGVDDLGAMIAAVEKLEDRVYGRPKQASEVTVFTLDAVNHLIAEAEAQLAASADGSV